MDNFVKITDEMFVKGEISKYLCKNVEIQYKGNQSDFQYRLDEAILGCESPIEQLLAIEFETIDLMRVHNFNPFIDVIDIEKQSVIECNGNTYRVDFLIPVWYPNQHAGKMFVVECDGHEFHQKTKEQVEKDNERTRNLQAAGYEVIRFSGTEIYHKAYKCAREVLKIILSKCKYTKED